MTEDLSPQGRLAEMHDALLPLLAEAAEGGRVLEPDVVTEALGLPELLHSVALAEEIIRAADGFHPVARFFAEGSEPQRYILDVLRRAE